MNNLNEEKIILISGPMYAGKSRQLISLFKEHENKKIIAIRPVLDTRTDTIVSRAGVSIPSVACDNLKEIENEIINNEIIFIDEFHFFNESLVELIEKYKGQKTFYLSGLDKDFRKVNFPMYTKFKKICDKEIKMTAICFTCGRIAKYSKKNLTDDNKDKIIEVDSLENPKYFSACERCHE